MITGEGKAGWRARFATDVRLIDKKVLCGGGAALLILAAMGAAANALGMAIVGAASTLASMAMADLGLALVAIGLLAPTSRQHPRLSRLRRPRPSRN